MSRNKLIRTLCLACAFIVMGTATTILWTGSAQAGIYNADAETVYQETWIVHEGNFTGTCDEANNRWYAEPENCPTPIEMDFTLPSIATIEKVEIFIDLWRNHDEQSARFTLNNSATVYKPNVGSDWSRTPYIKSFTGGQISAAGLKTGPNTIKFTDAAGAYHIHDVAIRVYSPAADASSTDGRLHKIKAGGALFDPYTSPNGTNLNVTSDQLQISAEVAGSVKFVEFHAYYDGYDDDNDGNFVEWHNANNNNWNPGAATSAWGNANPNPDTGSTINVIDKIEVSGAGIYTATWNLGHIVSQDDVRFKIRTIDNKHNVTDYYNVQDAAGGVSREFDLVRPNRPSMYFTIPGFEDFVLHHGGLFPNTQTVTINLPSDLSSFDSAYLVGAHYSNLYIRINGSQAFKAFPDANAQGQWDLSINNNVKQGAPTVDLFTLLQPGENTITYDWWHLHNPGSSQWGSFVEKPGPMLVLKRENSNIGGDSTPPELVNESPEDQETFVPVDTNIYFEVVDTNSGVNKGSIKLVVNSSDVTAQASITEQGGKMVVNYNPPADFGAGQTVTVDIDACDNASNCLDKTITFYTIAELGTAAQTDDFNYCSLNDSPVDWTFVDPRGDSSFQLDAAYEKLEIFVPANVNHDPFTTNNAARLLQPAANESYFGLDTKFDSVPEQKFQIQGMMVEEDANTYIRYDMFHNGSKLRLYMAAFNNGSQVTSIEKNMPNTLRYLRIGRNFNVWTFYGSSNGTNWIQYGEINFDMTVNKAGVYAGNAGGGGTPAPSYTAVIDYFKDVNDPFDGSEDADALVLPVVIEGQGTVVKSKECGKPVTLTATPNTGWSFAGWSGPVTGTTNPVEVSDWDKSDVVTALFTPGEYTVTINTSSINHLGQPFDSGSSVDSSKPSYSYGETVTLTAMPEPGWSVGSWSGAGLSGSNPVQTFTITGDTTVNITFVQDKYDLTINKIGAGNVTVNSSDASGRSYYIYGDEVTLTAVETTLPFNRWSGAVSGTENPITFAVTGDMTVTALFGDAVSIFLPLVTR